MGKKSSSKEKHSILRNPPLLILSLILALLPAIMMPFSGDVYSLSKTTFLYISTMILIFVFLIRSAGEEKLTIYRSALDLPVLLILVYAGMSLLFSGDPILGLVGKYRRYETFPAFVCYAAIYFFSVQLIRDSKNLEQAIKVLAVGFIPVVFYGIMQSAGYDFPGIYRFESRVHSSLGNPIILGTYLIIIIPLLFSLARNTHGEVWELFLWLMVPIGLINLLLTESRGAWLGLAASVLVVFLVRRRLMMRAKDGRRRDSASTKKKRLVVGITVALIITIAILFILPLGHFGQRLTSTLAISEGSAAIRIEIWKASLNMIADKPLLGFGFEQMGYWFPAYQTPMYAKLSPDGVADRTHNDLLQIAVDFGVPGLLLYIWMITIVFLSLFKIRSAPPYSTGLTAAIAGYFVQAQTGVPAVFITPVIWSLLGASMNIVRPGKSVKVALPGWLRSQFFLSAVGLTFIGLAVFAIKPVLADVYMYKAQQTARESQEQAVSEFEAVQRLYPYQSAYSKAITEFYLDYAGYTQANIYAQRAGLISELGLQYNEHDFELTYYVGESNFLSYRMTENEMYLSKAEDYFERAEKLLPDRSYIKGRLFDIAIIKGDSKKAFSEAEELIKLGVEEPRLYYFLGTEAQKSGDKKKAQAYLKRLKELEPGLPMKASNR